MWQMASLRGDVEICNDFRYFVAACYFQQFLVFAVPDCRADMPDHSFIV